MIHMTDTPNKTAILSAVLVNFITCVCTIFIKFLFSYSFIKHEKTTHIICLLFSKKGNQWTLKYEKLTWYLW